MELHPQISLAFNGQCGAAFRLYEECFNGTISFMITWGKSPAAADAPPEWGEKTERFRCRSRRRSGLLVSRRSTTSLEFRG